MKKVLLIIFITIGAFSCFAQITPEFAPVGATWYYQNETSIVGNAFDYTKFTSLDTITIAGRLCKDIVSNNFAAGDYYFYADSLHLYYYHTPGNNWAMLADFSKEVNDSFYVNLFTDSFAVYILAKGDTVINGYHLPYIITIPAKASVNGSPFCNYGGKIIYNIGSDIFLLPFIEAIDPGPGPLRCYDDVNIGLYKNPNFYNGLWPCDTITTGIEEVKWNTENVKVYPNPATNELTIEMEKSTGLEEINIIDVTGRVWEHVKPHQTIGQLNIAALPQGVYIVQIQNATGMIMSKVVKE